MWASTRKCSLVILVILIANTLILPKANDIKFEHISVEDGLPHSLVHCILEDRYGFLWFGTGQGLCRYDGYAFKVFKHDPEFLGSLSDSQVWSILEDSAGRLWVGTQNGGLNLMDRATGTFKSYQNIPGDTASLSNNGVWTIHESLNEPGILWIGTVEGGLNRFDIEDEKFERFQNDPNNPNSLSSDIIRSIFESPNFPDVLWIGTTRGGLNKMILVHPDSKGISEHDMTEPRFIRYLPDPENPESISHSGVWSICESRSEPGILWIGTYGGGLNRFNPRKGTFVSYQHNPENPNSLGGNLVKLVYESPNQPGILWIGLTNDGLDKVILPGKSGDENKPNLKFIHYKNDPNDPASLSINTVWSIYDNPSQPGLFWIGTWAGGLNKFNERKAAFLHFKHNPLNLNSLQDNNVWTIFGDASGALWIGTNKGLTEMVRDDDGQQHFTHYRHDPKNRNSLSHDIVRTIAQSPLHPELLWVGTWSRGLNKIILKKSESAVANRQVVPLKFIHYQHDPQNPNSLKNDIIKTLYFSRHQPEILWIGTADGGLDRFNTISEEFTHFIHDPDNPNSLNSNYVNVIHESLSDPQVLWIGTDGGGLSRLDTRNNQFLNYTHDSGNPNSLSDDDVRTLYESTDSPGTLWIGTSDGLNKFAIPTKGLLSRDISPTSLVFTHYFQKDGLPDDAILGFLEDDQGNFWISTNRGLSRFDPNTETFKNYNESDGLQSLEFALGAYFKSPRGEMFFGGINGFNAFYPDSITVNQHIPSIKIIDFKIFNKSVLVKPKSPLKKSILDVDEIELSYLDDFFSFEFVSLDYEAPEKNQYAYKMEGFDQDWIYCGNRRYASYTNLDPGTYTFRVKGSNNDGIWNEGGTAIRIVIAPPPWKTWWAYCLYGLSLLSLLFAWRRYELRKTQEKARLKEAHLRAEAAEFKSQAVEAQKEVEKEHMRSRIATDLHDEIGSNLSSIALIGEAMQHRDELGTEIRSNFADIYRAARSSSEAIRDIVWLINPMSDQLSDLITRMRETSRTVVGSQKLTFNTTGVDPVGKLNPEIKRNLYLIYKEALNNILKHSRATQIAINIQQQEEILTILIEDNGIGFDEKSVSYGSGLRNMKSRAKDISGSLWLQSDPGKGTEIKLSIKLT